MWAQITSLQHNAENKEHHWTGRIHSCSHFKSFFGLVAVDIICFLCMKWPILCLLNMSPWKWHFLLESEKHASQSEHEWCNNQQSSCQPKYPTEKPVRGKNYLWNFSWWVLLCRWHVTFLEHLKLFNFLWRQVTMENGVNNQIHVSQAVPMSSPLTWKLTGDIGLI